MTADKISRINAVSPSFCLAKWLQVTIDLVHGTTQSCHHPKRHRIPLDELAADPSALHNTVLKKQQRKMMLEGVRPSECDYCWRIEDLNQGLTSDRFVKSTDPWAYPALDRVRAMPWDAPVNPTYLEVMIDDRCNFSCMYCMADVSSSVALEMKKHGPYRLSTPGHRMPQDPPAAEPNPFVAAFWKWLPDILDGLYTLRITGGEPLLSPRFHELLALLARKPNPKLHLIVNSHLGHSDSRIESFIAQIEPMISQRIIGTFDIYTSVDAAGPRAEYIRHGLNYENLLRNVRKTASRLPGSEVVLMSTFNILSISSLENLLDDLVDIKASTPNVSIDLSYLANPTYLRATLADEELRSALERLRSSMDGPRKDRFSAHEKEKLRNVITWSLSPEDPAFVEQGRADLYSFLREYDRRKHKKFLEIFPEYRGLFVECKKAYFTKFADSDPTQSP